MGKTDDPAVMLPEAFLNKMRRLLGEEYEAFVQSYETERVQGLRLNTLKGEQTKLLADCGERFGLEPVPWCREGYYYRPQTRPGRHPFHEAGVYYIQEPSAMAAVSLLDVQPGEYVLDLCAAPGGKTTHIAERLDGMGLLVSNEIHPARAKILSQNAERMGICNGVVTNEDSSKLRQYFPEFFDRIVVDAPCSGEGMFRKDEQARAEWSEAHVAMCAVRQQEILDNAAAMLKPGGRMVYSTCTFSPEENEAGIAAFLGRHREFSVVHTEKEKRLPGLSCGRADWAGVSAGNQWAEAVGDTFRIWPHQVSGEGHFLALLQKNGGSGVSSSDDAEPGLGAVAASDGKRRKAKEKNRKTSFWNDKAGKKAVRDCLEQMMTAEAAEIIFREDRLILFGDQIYCLPEGIPGIDGLRVLRPGLHLGTLKKNRMEPSHALALALGPGQVQAAVRLPAESDELKAYLNGETLSCSPDLKGWVLVCAGAYSLGWGKASAGVLKNHYPKGLRIH